MFDCDSQTGVATVSLAVTGRWWHTTPRVDSQSHLVSSVELVSLKSAYIQWNQARRGYSPAT